MPFYKVVNDRKGSKVESRYWHAFESGDICEAGTLDVGIYGVTATKGGVTQYLAIEDIVEVRQVAFEDLLQGNTYTLVGELVSNIGTKLTSKPVTVKRSCEDETGDKMFLDDDGSIVWFYPCDNERAKFFEEKVAQESKPVYDAPSLTETTEAPASVPRKKVIYEVVSGDGTTVHRTKNRKKAREIKAILGGKESGAVIHLYALEKEIR